MGEKRGSFSRPVTAFGFVLGDHLLAAAAVAGQREGGNRIILGQNAAGDQRIDHPDEAACVAAGNGDAIAVANGLPVRGRQLREAVGPAAFGAVRGGGVDDADMLIFHQRHRFPCGGVGQAEEGDVGCVDQPFAFVSVLAQLACDAEQLDVVPALKAFVNAQAGSAFAAVDKDFCFSHFDQVLSVLFNYTISPENNNCNIFSISPKPSIIFRYSLFT